MSFHEPGSDVSRLNRLACRAPVRVDPETLAVLVLARQLSAASGGLFDITMAGDLVADGFLPAPSGAEPPHPAANWQDVRLQKDGHVSFRRPLWIDLGGIAKGYAVDLALQAARRPAGISVCINAGGDLRIAGPQAVDVSLAVAGPTGIRHRAALSLRNRALASSQGLPASRRAHPALRVPHRDGRTGRALPAARFVSVLAPRCVLADALTKVVLGRGRAALPLLRRYGATALLHEPIAGWRRIGTRA